MISGLYSSVKAILALKDGYDSSTGSTDEKLVGALAALKKEAKNSLVKYDGNMANVLSDFMVEPVMIISNNVARDDISKQILELNMDLFCSSYVQIFEILKVMDGLNSREAISLLSTDKDSLPSSIRDYSIDNYLKLKSKMSFESYDVKPGDELKFGLESLTISNEDNDDFTAAIQDMITKKETITKAAEISKMTEEEVIAYGKEVAIRVGKARTKAEADAAKKEQDDFNREFSVKKKNETDEAYRKRMESIAATGKQITESDYKGYDLMSTILYKTFYVDMNKPLYEAEGSTVIDKYYKVRFPITIKARVIFAKPEDIVTMIEPFNTNANFFTRLEDYRSGAISFFKDLVWCDDLIRDAKKAKLHDEKNLIKLINDRTSSANAKITNARPGIGFEKNYNMLILAEDDLTAIENAIGGKLKEEVNMNKLLRVSQSLACAIVDFDHERVNLSLSGGIGKSSTTFQALKKKSNGGKEDLTELVKMLMSNKALTF